MKKLTQPLAPVHVSSPACCPGGQSSFVRAPANVSQLKKLAESTLGSGNLNVAVRLPEGERLEEWIAVHSTWRG